MLNEFAHMSCGDGLVMQLHVGSLRDHNRPLAARFGPDIGADIPVATDWTRGLRPLLDACGNDSRFALVLYTLDESTYSRELAPLAGHYPAVRLGCPWWFHDSPAGIDRFLDRVTETAGIYNLAGFVDDARALTALPARHDLWRRRTCGWLARKVGAGFLDEDEARARPRARVRARPPRVPTGVGGLREPTGEATPVRERRPPTPGPRQRVNQPSVHPLSCVRVRNHSRILLSRLASISARGRSSTIFECRRSSSASAYNRSTRRCASRRRKRFLATPFRLRRVQASHPANKREHGDHHDRDGSRRRTHHELDQPRSLLQGPSRTTRTAAQPAAHQANSASTAA